MASCYARNVELPFQKMEARFYHLEPPSVSFDGANYIIWQCYLYHLEAPSISLGASKHIV